MSNVSEELLLVTQNKDIKLINELYESLDDGLLVLFLEYVKNVVAENIGEELSFLRELNFYEEGLFCQFYYVNSKREEYCYPFKIDSDMLKDFKLFTESFVESLVL